MIQETQQIIRHGLDFLPLKSYANIHEGNALQIDWKAVAPEVDYIISNPPFVGGMFLNDLQKKDHSNVRGNIVGVGETDFVSCRYKKAADFIVGTEIRCAVVSTNSITQGQQACTIWKPLLESKIHIDFAYRTSPSFDYRRIFFQNKENGLVKS